MDIELRPLIEKEIQQGVFAYDEVLDAAVLPDHIHEGAGERRYFFKQCGDRRLKLSVSVAGAKMTVLKAQWVEIA